MAENDDSLSYLELQRQIQALQARAEQTRIKELEAVINDMKEKIALYKIDANDLGLEIRVEADSEQKKEARPAVKFRDNAGNTWTGKGARPLWLKKKIAEGNKLEDFKIQ